MSTANYVDAVREMAAGKKPTKVYAGMPKEDRERLKEEKKAEKLAVKEEAKAEKARAKEAEKQAKIDAKIQAKIDKAEIKRVEKEAPKAAKKEARELIKVEIKEAREAAKKTVPQLSNDEKSVLVAHNFKELIEAADNKDDALEEIKAGLKTKDWVKILVDQWKAAKQSALQEGLRVGNMLNEIDPDMLAKIAAERDNE